MSVLCETIIEEIDQSLREEAVAKFAQVLADCESSKWTVAQAAHEDVHEMQCSMGDDYDQFLADATTHMIINELEPNRWLPG